MTDLTHETEVEIHDPTALPDDDMDEAPIAIEGTCPPSDVSSAPVAPKELATGTDAEIIITDPVAPAETEETPTEQLTEHMSVLSASDTVPEPIEVEEEESTFFIDTAPHPVVNAEVEQQLDDLFFVDTAPAAAEDLVNTQKPNYRPDAKSAIGRKSAPEDEDEEIVFAPKTYKQPQPIIVDMQLASPSRRRSSPPRPVITKVAPPPKGLSRAQKKAAKREKYKGKKAKRARRQAELAVGSDVSWGSDGPPGGGGDILDVEGADQSDGEDDVAVLRDYLAGTLLNERVEKNNAVEDDSDGSVSAESEESELDSDEVDEAIDIDMMKQLGDGVSRWNELGLNHDSDGSEDEEEVDDEEDSDDDEEETGSQDFEIDDDDDSNYEDASDSGSGSGSDSDSVAGDGINHEMEEDIDRQLALALEQGGEEDSEVEELFTGKAGWGDDTDWFIQSMEVSHVILVRYQWH